MVAVSSDRPCTSSPDRSRLRSVFSVEHALGDHPTGGIVWYARKGPPARVGANRLAEIQ
jgi:hypothetical protein